MTEAYQSIGGDSKCRFYQGCPSGEGEGGGKFSKDFSQLEGGDQNSTSNSQIS